MRVRHGDRPGHHLGVDGIVWVVEANGDESTYTYLVDAPETASEVDVACCAYAQHGTLYGWGRVPEFLGPDYVAYWLDPTPYVEEAVKHVVA